MLMKRSMGASGIASRRPVPLACLAFGLLLLVASTARADLITNSDFESGSTGFSSDYTFQASKPPDMGESRYSVVTSAFDVHTAWTTGGDHTSGSGSYFVANGSSDASKAVWQTSSPINVTQAGTAYRFEAWITSVYTVSAGSPGPALSFQVGNGTDWYTMGTSQTFPNGYTPGQWRLTYYDGVFSSTGQYYLRLLNTQTALGGNDLGVDDLYFGLSSNAPSVGTNPVGQDPQGIEVTPVPEPTGLLLLSLGGVALFGISRRRSRRRTSV